MSQYYKLNPSILYFDTILACDANFTNFCRRTTLSHRHLIFDVGALTIKDYSLFVINVIVSFLFFVALFCESMFSVTSLDSVTLS